MSDLMDTITYTITLTSATHLVLLQHIIIVLIFSSNFIKPLAIVIDLSLSNSIRVN
jgi:hypothetical protein